MLGLLVILVISGLLLHVIEKKNITVLGIVPNAKSIGQFLIGCFIIGIAVLINIYIETAILKIEWKLNYKGYTAILEALVYHLRSALTEDLIFRGAILYILIRRIGAAKAILISAITFGIYHWFSYGIIGESMMLLAYVFLVTGLTGYIWAYSFYKTKSIMLALGFHLGYNLIMACFFEAQPYGELIMTQVSKGDLTGWYAFYFSMFKGLFPSIFTLVCLKLLLKTHWYQELELPYNEN